MTETIGKLFFTRHGQTVEANSPSDKQTDGAVLSPGGIKQVKKNAKKLKKLLDPNSKIIFLYDKNTERTKESLFYLLNAMYVDTANVQKIYDKETFDERVDEINRNNINIEIKSDTRLKTMTKQFINDKDYIKNTNILQTKEQDKARSDTSSLLFELLSKKYVEQNDNIPQYVLIGHKSNAESIVKGAEPKSNKTMRIEHDEIIDLDIVETYIPERKGELDYEIKYFDKDKNNLNITINDKLYLNNQTIACILKHLKNEGDIRKEIQKFFDKKTSLIGLQHFINNYFEQHPELYEKYLDSDNEDISIFCLSNLIRVEDYHTINIFLKKYLKSLSTLQQKNIFDIINKEESILELFLKIFFEDKEKTNEYNNFKSYILEELIKLGDNQVLLMNYYENIYPLIKEIREKSLDMRIVNGEDIDPEFNLNGDITNAKLKSIVKIKDTKKIKDSDDIKDLDISNIAIKQAVASILSRNMSHNIGSHILGKLGLLDKKILYIEANSGSGKSFLLSQINERFKNTKFMIDEERMFPIFINLSGRKSIEEIRDIIESKQNDYKNILGQMESVVILDSLDESNFNDTDRKKLLAYLTDKSQLSSDVIITSRKGYISKDTLDEKRTDIFKKIDIVQIDEMNDINIDKYVKEYFENKENNSKKIAEFNKIKNNQRLNGIEKNPLILSMICYLIEIGDDIENIYSISELYEKIIDLRLKYRENIKEKQGRKILVYQEDTEQGEEEKNSILDKRKKFLGELAYQDIMEGKKIDEENFSMLKKQYPGIIPDNDCLNLLFRKNNNKEYDFVHQTLKEYFAAKEFVYKTSQKKGEALELYLKKFILSSLEKIDFGVLMFICKFLSDEKNQTIREHIINYIITYQDYYISNTHNKIVYLLDGLGALQIDKYLENIIIDEDILKPLIDSGSDIWIDKNISIVNNTIQNNNIDYNHISILLKLLINDGRDKCFDAAKNIIESSISVLLNNNDIENINMLLGILINDGKERGFYSAKEIINSYKNQIDIDIGITNLIKKGFVDIDFLYQDYIVYEIDQSKFVPDLIISGGEKGLLIAKKIMENLDKKNQKKILESPYCSGEIGFQKAIKLINNKNIDINICKKILQIDKYMNFLEIMENYDVFNQYFEILEKYVSIKGDQEKELLIGLYTKIKKYNALRYNIIITLIKHGGKLGMEESIKLIYKNKKHDNDKCTIDIDIEIIKAMLQYGGKEGIEEIKKIFFDIITDVSYFGGISIDDILECLLQYGGSQGINRALELTQNLSYKIGPVVLILLISNGGKKGMQRALEIVQQDLYCDFMASNFYIYEAFLTEGSEAAIHTAIKINNQLGGLEGLYELSGAWIKIQLKKGINPKDLFYAIPQKEIEISSSYYVYQQYLLKRLINEGGEENISLAYKLFKDFKNKYYKSEIISCFIKKTGNIYIEDILDIFYKLDESYTTPILNDLIVYGGIDGFEKSCELVKHMKREYFAREILKKLLNSKYMNLENAIKLYEGIDFFEHKMMILSYLISLGETIGIEKVKELYDKLKEKEVACKTYILEEMIEIGGEANINFVRIKLTELGIFKKGISDSNKDIFERYRKRQKTK